MNITLTKYLWIYGNPKEQGLATCAGSGNQISRGMHKKGGLILDEVVTEEVGVQVGSVYLRLWSSFYQLT